RRTARAAARREQGTRRDPPAPARGGRAGARGAAPDAVRPASADATGDPAPAHPVAGRSHGAHRPVRGRCARPARDAAPVSVWDDVVGQPDAVGVLRRAATEGPMTHAWLLTGPPGSGRSTAARAFAAALQCERGGCGVCHECRTVLAGSHPDVALVATEHVFLRVEDVRPLVTVAQQRPSLGRWRVIVVEDADRLNDTSGNLLLKAVEEPPPRTVWLLCAP